jgi:PAS domain S-box-containing protein
MIPSPSLARKSIFSQIVRFFFRARSGCGVEPPSKAHFARLHAMLNSVGDGIVMFDHAWRFVYINDVSEKWNRIKRDQLLGKSVWETFPDSVDSAFYREYHRAVEENTPVIFEEHLRGSWLEVRAFPSAEGLTVYFRDVTNRRQAMAALKESEARFQMVAKATSDALWDWSVAEDRLWWSDGLQKLFGWSPEEMEAGLAAWQSRLHPEDATRAYEDFSRAVEQGRETWEGQYRFRRKDGSYAHVHDRAFIQRNEQQR